MKLYIRASNSLSIIKAVFIILFYTGAFLNICFGQSPVFQHFDVRDGLAQNTVLSISQDARGFMWFCTPEGVNRYDSRVFRTYHSDPADPHSISSNYTTSSLYDSHQTLWIGTDNGLNKYDPKTDSFQQFFRNPADKSSLSDSQILCIYEDNKGSIWVGTVNGLNRLIDSSTGQFERYMFSNTAQNNINSIHQDQEGSLWLATNNGLIKTTFTQGKLSYNVFLHDQNKPTSITNNIVTSITTDLQNNLWVGTRSGTLDRYNPASKSFIHVHEKLNKTSATHNEINCMYTDKVGTIWIGTVEGIIQLEPATMHFTLYQTDPDNPHSLRDNSIYSIFRDSQGSLWAGTYYNGVGILRPDNAPFHVLKAHPHQSSRSNERINCIAGDRKHNFWIGADGEGLNYINLQTGLISHYAAGLNPEKNLPSNQIKAVHVDKDGYTWVAMRRGGLSRLDPAHRQWITYHYSSDKNHDNILALLEDSQHRFWCLTTDALLLFNKQKGTFQAYPVQTNSTSNVPANLSSSSGIVLVEDTHKNIWLGGQTGAYRLKNKNNQLEWFPFKGNSQNVSSPSHGFVHCMHEDYQGRLWIGTVYNGLKRFDAQRNTFIDYTEADGITEKNYYGHSK